MERMIFAGTEEGILEATKWVTRRRGWTHLRAGMMVQPIRKSLGVQSGSPEAIIRAPLMIRETRREPLRRMIDDPVYGERECILEGYGTDPVLCRPRAFVEMLCDMYADCTPDSLITRIAFLYTDYDGAKRHATST